MTSIRQTLDDVFSLYDRFGKGIYFGENISQEDHAVQAALLAEEEGYDTEVVLAALLHDIGHFMEDGEDMGNLGKIDHETLGAKWLRERGFGQRLCLLIANHVSAKRYLTFKDETYYNKLSEASRQTLEFQGGRMTPEEAGRYEQNPMFELFIRMRHWDEAAKVPGMDLPPIGSYRAICTDYLNNITEHEA